ncbi:O-antigen ligase family protein [Novipirellula sp. SH528]|uniref:O-antigen ligase family protein n=1 Tax=Novipirellula sp. SH528 TaxID=3454466 RepID=UPI003FA0896D
MATAVFNTTEDRTISRIDTDVDDRHGWGFVLLLATTATLFVRPADLVPAFDKWPIYQFLILACLVVSSRACLRQFSHAKLTGRPITACLFVLLVSVAVSHLSHGFFWAARASVYEVSKLLALFGLITGLVNTLPRLVFFLNWLIAAITTMASLAMLDHFGYVSIVALESIQDRGVIEYGVVDRVERIRWTGIFQDPNDFGLTLVTGVVLCIAFLCRSNVGWPRYVWLVPATILLASLALTHSRGALLSLLCAVPTAIFYFRGGKIAALAVLPLPVLAMAFSRRMTDVNAIKDGTGQDRLQIWSDSLEVFFRYPLFGLGEGLIADELGIVTHNSFLHCFAELGLFGGTAFVACFLAASIGLWSRRRSSLDRLTCGNANSAEGEDLSRLCGFIFAALIASMVAMLTISRQFVAPTYLILGVVSAACCIPEGRTLVSDASTFRLGNRFLVLSVFASVTSLVAFYLTVRVFVRW